MSINAHNSNFVNFTLHTNICNFHMTLYLTELLASNWWYYETEGKFDREDSYLGPLAWFMRSDSGDRTLLNIVSTAHYLFRRGKKKDNRKHDLNQERIHGWPKYYKKNRKNKWQRQINRYPTGLSTGQYWAYATGLERKEDGKPCVISVTMILSEKLFRRSSPYFKQVFFCKRPENITPSKDYHKTRK